MSRVVVVGPDTPSRTAPGELTPEPVVSLAHDRGCAATIVYPFRRSRVHTGTAVVDAIFDDRGRPCVRDHRMDGVVQTVTNTFTGACKSESRLAGRSADSGRSLQPHGVSGATEEDRQEADESGTNPGCVATGSGRLRLSGGQDLYVLVPTAQAPMSVA
jgi:hypothetical protein